MIPPAKQWAIQIEVTNVCPRKCANCTRLLRHAQERIHPSLSEIANAIAALSGWLKPPVFPRENHAGQIIGIMGGEPLLRPDFEELTKMVEARIPNPLHRGLWTGLKLEGHKWEPLIRRVYKGYINNNLHDPPSVHQPMLMAVGELVDDPWRCWELIEQCWVQQRWSSSITPKGFFFCEVAAAMDWVFGGPGGLPVDSRCWAGSLQFKNGPIGTREPEGPYAEQIKQWCPRCGGCVPCKPRKDSDNCDDITPDNLGRLWALGSPGIARGEYELIDTAAYSEYDYPEWAPHKYLGK